MRLCFLLFLVILLSVRCFSLFDSLLLLNAWFIILFTFLLCSIAYIWWIKNFITSAAAFITLSLISFFYLKNPALNGYSIDYKGNYNVSLSNYPTVDLDDFIISKHINFPIQPGSMYGVKVKGKRYRKRLHGMPGDKIHICNSKVYINGLHYSVENNWHGQSNSDFSKCDKINQVFTLKADEYYFIGDNLYNSYDSRKFGAVRAENIISKFLYIIKSNDSIKNAGVDFK